MIRTRATEISKKIPLKADLRPELGVGIFIVIV
jgi:hypothetical protein